MIPANNLQCRLILSAALVCGLLSVSPTNCGAEQFADSVLSASTVPPAPAPMMQMMPGCNMMMMSGMGSPAIFSKAFDWTITPKAPLVPKHRIPFVFDIRGKKDHKPLADLELVHEKPCHLVIVSKDLTVFQHIHPEVIGPGKMRVATELPREGDYTFYLQFKVRNGEEYSLKENVRIGGHGSQSAHLTADADQAKTFPLMALDETSDARVDDTARGGTPSGYQMKILRRPAKAGREAFLTVAIEHNGKPYDKIQPFLGTGGHGVMISEDLGEFIHIHPQKTLLPGDLYSSPVSLYVLRIDKPGLYKTWVQFKVEGKMLVGSWTLPVTE